MTMHHDPNYTYFRREGYCNGHDVLEQFPRHNFHGTPKGLQTCKAELEKYTTIAYGKCLILPHQQWSLYPFKEDKREKAQGIKLLTRVSVNTHMTLAVSCWKTRPSRDPSEVRDKLVCGDHLDGCLLNEVFLSILLETMTNLKISELRKGVCFT